MLIQDIKKQKNEWKRKGWAIPELRGSKQDWYAILQELLRIIDENNAVDMNDKPILVATENTYSWRTYAPFLKGVGMVANKSGQLTLTQLGQQFCEKPTKRFIANFLE